MHDGSSNHDAPYLPCLPLPGIDDDKVIRQNHWLTYEIKNLSTQLHLDSFGESESLESLAEINLLVSHRTVQRKFWYGRPLRKNRNGCWRPGIMQRFGGANLAQ